jgi:hypothetical protein
VLLSNHAQLSCDFSTIINIRFVIVYLFLIELKITFSALESKEAERAVVASPPEADVSGNAMSTLSSDKTCSHESSAVAADSFHPHDWTISSQIIEFPAALDGALLERWLGSVLWTMPAQERDSMAAIVPSAASSAADTQKIFRMKVSQERQAAELSFFSFRLLLICEMSRINTIYSVYKRYPLLFCL